jgi:hypothetical protein
MYIVPEWRQVMCLICIWLTLGSNFAAEGQSPIRNVFPLYKAAIQFPTVVRIPLNLTGCSSSKRSLTNSPPMYAFFPAMLELWKIRTCCYANVHVTHTHVLYLGW